ncbi:MAG: tetratricopeptide repeat protein [Planctomycetaceae bacterium]
MKNPSTEPSPVDEPVVPVVSTSDTVSPSEQGLPEEELMTPEFAQEEAERGDFVIRWAVILLALLLGWTHVTSTATLTDIRVGQFLRSNGLLPPRTDTLSSTLTDTPWVNASWLGDLLLGIVYDLGGDIGLTLWNALLTGLSFWCLCKVTRVGVSTWWGSLCLLAALITVFPLLTPGPTLITVLGVSLMLLLLHRYSESPHGTTLWWSAGLMFFWSNLDERAYYGLVMLVLFALGQLLQPALCGCRKRLGTIVGVAIVASCLHPFPGSVLTAPIEFHQTFLPAMRDFGGDLSSEFPHLWSKTTDGNAWTGTGPYLWSALMVAGMAFIAFLLNLRKLDRGWLLLAIGMNVVGLLSGADFTAVAIVNAVVATLFAQAWYVDNIRQEYSIDAKELLFSRGGRAITVLGLFALAYLAISGWMTGADGRRIGVGFSAELQADIDGYRDLVGNEEDRLVDDQLYHFTPRQGDLLLWSGRRSFTDSRLSLFATGTASPLETQRQIASDLVMTGDLRQPAAFEAWVKKRAQVLRDTGTMQVVVPLNSPLDYAIWSNLLEQSLPGNGEAIRLWRQLALAGPGARLIRLDGLSPELQAYVLNQPNSSTIAKTFWKKQEGDGVNRSMFPIQPTFYEESLLLPKVDASNEIRIGEHYLQRLMRGRLNPPEVAAYCHQAIRHLRRGLFNHHNDESGYRALGTAYTNLYFLEQGLVENGVAALLVERRYYQAIAALHHALLRNPDDLNVESLLLQLYVQTNQNDLAIDTLERIRDLTAARDGDDGSFTAIAPDSPDYAHSRQEMKQVYDSLRTLVYETLVEVQQTVSDQNGQVATAVEMAISRGCPRIALDTIEADRTQLSFPVTAGGGDPQAFARVFRLNLFYIRSLLLAGRTSDAWDVAEGLRADLDGGEGSGEPLVIQQDLSRMQYLIPLIGYTNLAADRTDAAAEYWQKYGDRRLAFGIESTLMSLPGVALPDDIADRAMAFHLAAALDLQTSALLEWSSAQFQVALCELEQGRNFEATVMLRQIIDSDPEGPLRRHAAFYLSLLTGEQVPFDGPERTRAAYEAARLAARRASRPPSPHLPQRPIPNDPLPAALD